MIMDCETVRATVLLFCNDEGMLASAELRLVVGGKQEIVPRLSDCPHLKSDFMDGVTKAREYLRGLRTADGSGLWPIDTDLQLSLRPRNDARALPAIDGGSATALIAALGENLLRSGGPADCTCTVTAELQPNGDGSHVLRPVARVSEKVAAACRGGLTRVVVAPANLQEAVGALRSYRERQEAVAAEACLGLPDIVAAESVPEVVSILTGETRPLLSYLDKVARRMRDDVPLIPPEWRANFFDELHQEHEVKYMVTEKEDAPDGLPRETEVERRERWLDWSSNKHRVTITADAGHGKSTLLRWITWRTARRSAAMLRSYEAGVSEVKVPFFFRCEDISTADNTPLIDSMLTSMRNDYALDDEQLDLLGRLLKTDRAIIACDALDEVDRDEQRILARRLRNFADNHRGPTVYLTCRTRDLPEFSWPTGERETAQIELAEFDATEMDAFINTWGRVAGDTESAATLIEHLSKEPTLHSVASVPLFSTLSCIAYIGREAHLDLPMRRTELLEDCWMAFNERWEADKGRSFNLSILERRYALEKVAWHFASRGVFGSFSGTKLLEVLSRTPAADGETEEGRNPEEVLAELPLLVPDGPPHARQYRFQVRLLHEYFAASALARRENPFAIIEPVLHHPEWQEVIRLTAGLLEGERVAEYVGQILDADSEAEPILGRDLLLACHCCGEARPEDLEGTAQFERLVEVLEKAAKELIRKAEGRLIWKLREAIEGSRLGGMDLMEALTGMRSSFQPLGWRIATTWGSESEDEWLWWYDDSLDYHTHPAADRVLRDTGFWSRLTWKDLRDILHMLLRIPEDHLNRWRELSERESRLGLNPTPRPDSLCTPKLSRLGPDALEELVRRGTEAHALLPSVRLLLPHLWSELPYSLKTGLLKWGRTELDAFASPIVLAYAEQSTRDVEQRADELQLILCAMNLETTDAVETALTDWIEQGEHCRYIGEPQQSSHALLHALRQSGASSAIPEVIPVFRRLLEHPHAGFRCMALHLLMKVKLEDAVVVLTDAFNSDEDARVRQTALYLLPEVAQSRAAVLQLVNEGLDDQNVRVRRQCIDTIRRLKAVDEVEPKLIQLSCQDPEPAVRAEAASILAETASGWQHLPDGLRAALDAPDTKIRDNAVWLFRRAYIPPELAVPWCRKVLERPESELHMDALDLLGRFESPSTCVRSLITRATETADIEVCKKALHLLWKPVFAPELVLDSITEGMHSTEEALRAYAVELLPNLALPAETVLPLCIEALSDLSREVASASIKTLRSLGEKALAAVPAVVNHIAGEDRGSLRAECVGFLIDVAPDALRDVPLSVLRSCYASSSVNPRESGALLSAIRAVDPEEYAEIISEDKECLWYCIPTCTSADWTEDDADAAEWRLEAAETILSMDPLDFDVSLEAMLSLWETYWSLSGEEPDELCDEVYEVDELRFCPNLSYLDDEEEEWWRENRPTAVARSELATRAFEICWDHLICRQLAEALRPEQILQLIGEMDCGDLGLRWRARTILEGAGECISDGVLANRIASALQRDQDRIEAVRPTVLAARLQEPLQQWHELQSVPDSERTVEWLNSARDLRWRLSQTFEKMDSERPAALPNRST